MTGELDRVDDDRDQDELEEIAAELLETEYDEIVRDGMRAKRLKGRVSVDERRGYHWRTSARFDQDELGAE